MKAAAITLFLVIMFPALAQPAELRRVTYDSCVPMTGEIKQVQVALYKDSVIALAKQLLFYLEAEESFARRKQTLNNWKLENDAVMSTSYAQYLDVLSAGSLHDFSISYQTHEQQMCSKASAYGSVQEFRRMIENIRDAEENLPQPEYVEFFYELPDYHRVQ